MYVNTVFITVVNAVFLPLYLESLLYVLLEFGQNRITGDHYGIGQNSVNYKIRIFYLRATNLSTYMRQTFLERYPSIDQISDAQTVRQTHALRKPLQHFSRDGCVQFLHADRDSGSQYRF